MKLPLHRPEQRHRIVFGESQASVGDGDFLVIAGPCSVESRDGILATARGVAAGGAGMLRGGAWKPRTSPHSF
ncbi:MAG: 3-deoxy-7-phosphoheptulonate synthase, partial [Gaiellales bacterium]